MASKKTNPHPRRYPGTTGRGDKCEFRRSEAKERQEAYVLLSIQEKLELLDRRLGKGVGAAKQRARLALASEKGKQAPAQDPQQSESERLKAKDRRNIERRTK